MPRQGAKIKRFDQIQRRRKKTRGWVKALLALLCVLVCAVAGWILFPPIYDFIMDFGEAPPAVSQPVTAPVDEGQPAASDAASVTPAPSSEPAQPQPAATEDLSALQGAYLPAAIAGSDALQGWMAQAVALGLNTALVDAKDAQGLVLFDSGHALARRGNKNEPVYRARELADALRQQGLTPAARLFAFEDGTAAVYERDYAVKYEDTDFYWLDNAAAEGGRAWLNPYSAGARDYIKALAQELCESGFEMIVVESMHFPTGYSLGRANYGETNGVTRAKLLAGFIVELRALVEENGARLLVCAPGSWPDGGGTAVANQSLIYGGDPADLYTDGVVLSLSDRTASWKTQLDAYFAKNEQAQTLALLPGGDRTALASALQSAGGAGYILYDPQGSYQ